MLQAGKVQDAEFIPSGKNSFIQGCDPSYIHTERDFGKVSLFSGRPALLYVTVPAKCRILKNTYLIVDFTHYSNI